jgi:hypothetical protein
VWKKSLEEKEARTKQRRKKKQEEAKQSKTNGVLLSSFNVNSLTLTFSQVSYIFDELVCSSPLNFVGH